MLESLSQFEAPEGDSVVQKTQVVLIDDIDGSEGDETVTFALDGASYEIDLSAAHAAELRESLSQWIGHGRKTVARSTPRATASCEQKNLGSGRSGRAMAMSGCASSNDRR